MVSLAASVSSSSDTDTKLGKCLFTKCCTGCPKSKVTILIFNNFLMKEVV